jgi:integrating conjugative element protein (TIGR03761 family)
MNQPFPSLDLVDIRLPEIRTDSAGPQANLNFRQHLPASEPTFGRLAAEQPDAMTLHTREAWRLFSGRQADSESQVSAIPGARRYAAILRSIWSLSAQDNPYADWFLVRTDHSLSDLRSQMDLAIWSREAEFERLRRRGLALSVLASSRPAQVELGFRSPYGYAVAQAVLDFDLHVRMVQTLVLKDQLTDDAGRTAIRDIGRMFRSLFQAAIAWERGLLSMPLAGLCRQDFQPNADQPAQSRAQAAVALFGEVPSAVFSNAETPRHSLRRVQAKEGSRRSVRAPGPGAPAPMNLALSEEPVHGNEGLL